MVSWPESMMPHRGMIRVEANSLSQNFFEASSQYEAFLFCCFYLNLMELPVHWLTSFIMLDDRL